MSAERFLDLLADLVIARQAAGGVLSEPEEARRHRELKGVWDGMTDDDRQLRSVATPEPPEVDMGGCAAMGVAGFHSDHYADPDDGICQWCGERAPALEEPPDSDPDLTTLRALNARIEALQLSRGEGPPDPALDASIDALEHEAAGLIQARTDRSLKPINERFEAAMAVARRFLRRDPETP
jgi:hypothetical protein